MTVNYLKEMSLYRQIAGVIGGTVEDVCNMQEKEREELITVLELKAEETIDKYNLDTPYRTRNLVKKENLLKEKCECETALPAAFGDNDYENVIEKAKSVNNNFENSNADEVIKHKPLVRLPPNESDAAADQNKNVVRTFNEGDVLTQNSSTESPSPRVRNRLSLKKKPKVGEKYTSGIMKRDISYVQFDMNNFKLNRSGELPLSETLPSFLIQHLSDPPSTGRCSSKGLLSRLPVPVLTVLARLDLPLYCGHVSVKETHIQAVDKYSEDLGLVFKKMLQVKSGGLAHCNGLKDDWLTKGTCYPLGLPSTKECDNVIDETISCRSVNKSRCKVAVVESNYSSDEFKEPGRGKHKQDPDWSPFKQSKNSPSESGQIINRTKRKLGLKRKLFNKQYNYMDDSADTDDEATQKETERRKCKKSRKEIIRTVERLKQAGSFTDLLAENTNYVLQ